MTEEIPESVSSTLSKLPAELQSIIRRKCSRDPKTRFTYKIHLLLAFILTNSHLEDEVGIGWVSEQEFRINKKRLVELLGIKMNSMNVNLHDLGFHKMQHEKNGWTRWTRDGFTQNRILLDTDLDPPPENVKMKKQATIELHSPDETLTMGSVLQSVCDIFYETVIDIWRHHFSQDLNAKLTSKSFIGILSELAKRPEQPLSNAIKILESIINPSNLDELSFKDLLRFLAMFGPVETSMIKIGHLAKCTIASNWAFFKAPLPTEIVSMSFHGRFDENEINRFTVTFEVGLVKKVWNNPLIDAYGCYLADDKATTYSSWFSYYDFLQKF